MARLPDFCFSILSTSRENLQFSSLLLALSVQTSLFALVMIETWRRFPHERGCHPQHRRGEHREDSQFWRDQLVIFLWLNPLIFWWFSHSKLPGFLNSSGWESYGELMFSISISRVHFPAGGDSPANWWFAGQIIWNPHQNTIKTLLKPPLKPPLKRPLKQQFFNTTCRLSGRQSLEHHFLDLAKKRRWKDLARQGQVGWASRRWFAGFGGFNIFSGWIYGW